MSAYLELMVSGGHLACLDARSVVAIIYPKGGDASTVATPSASMTVVLSGGETMPPVFGLSGDDLLVACAYARAKLKESEGPLVILRWKDLPQRVADAKAAAGVE